MPTSAYFNGQTITEPGVYSTSNIAALNPLTLGALNKIALVGISLGGKPNTDLKFTDPSVAKAVLKGGDLLNAANGAWKQGATEIHCIRVDPATQASLSVKDVGGTVVGTFTSLDYGNWTNNIQVSIASGSTSGKMVQIKYYPNNVIETGDNLGNAFSIQYDGNGSAATLTITDSLNAPTGLTATPSTTGGTIATSTAYFKVTALNASGESAGSSEVSASVTGPTGSVALSWTAVAGATKYNVYAANASGAELFSQQVTGTSATVTSYPSGTAVCPTTNSSSVDFVVSVTGASDGSGNIDITLDGSKDTRFTNLAAVVNYINGQVGYTASLIGSGSLTSSIVDTIASQDVKTSAYTVTAQLGSIQYWVNNNSQFVSFAIASGQSQAPTNIGFANLIGGSDGTTTTTQWTNALDTLSTMDVDIVVPLTATSSVWSSYDANIQEMAKSTNQLRFGIYGGSTGVATSAAVANAAILNSRRAAYVHPGVQDVDAVSGQVTTFPEYIAAAYVAGLIAGQPGANVPITHKKLNIIGVETVLQDSDIVTLLQGGVVPIQALRKGGFETTQGITTWLFDTNLANVEISLVRLIDEINDDITSNLSPYIGQPISQSVLTSMIGTVGAVLRSYSPPQGSRINGFQNIIVQQSSTQPNAVSVSYEVSLTVPMDYILVTLNVSPS